MTLARFQPGDRIIGNEINTYGFTGKGSILDVVDMKEDRWIDAILIKSSPVEFGTLDEIFFGLDQEMFDILAPSNNRSAIIKLRRY